MMNFFVWRRGIAKPTASLQDLDPRSSIDWKVHEDNTIAIVKLPEEQRGFTLDEAIAAYPCPQVV